MKTKILVRTFTATVGAAALLLGCIEFFIS